MEVCSPPPINQITLNFTSPPAVSALEPHYSASNGRIQKPWKSRGRPPFQVAHLSDVHIDRKYTVSMISRVCVCARNSGELS